LTERTNYIEKDWLARIKVGDQQAFAELYRAYSDKLYRSLLRLVKSEPMAEELLQDIFVQFWEKRESIDIQSGLQAYLLRIGENKVYDFYRKLKRDQKLLAVVKAAASENYIQIGENLLSEENTELLRRAIETLPPQRRQVFEYCKLQGRSYQETSELLGISSSTINDHIVKATKAIRKFIYAHQKATALLLVFSIFKELR
jgi:RNA polymerase sigma-70 factor (ECF subfamily)